MRLGKISAILLGIALVTMCALTILRPGWGNPLAALGGLLIMFSFPAALIFGIVGVICDRRKLLAIITTTIAGGFVLFYMCMIAISIIMFRWACRLPSLILTFNQVELWISHDEAQMEIALCRMWNCESSFRAEIAFSPERSRKDSGVWGICLIESLSLYEVTMSLQKSQLSIKLRQNTMKIVVQFREISLVRHSDKSFNSNGKSRKQSGSEETESGMPAVSRTFAALRRNGRRDR